MKSKDKGAEFKAATQLGLFFKPMPPLLLGQLKLSAMEEFLG
jgi:hypothetical protein